MSLVSGFAPESVRFFRREKVSMKTARASNLGRSYHQISSVHTKIARTIALHNTAGKAKPLVRHLEVYLNMCQARRKPNSYCKIVDCNDFWLINNP